MSQMLHHQHQFILATDPMIYVQNGFSYHGEVWFDNFQLPSQLSLYRATLEITLDSSTSRIFAYDSLNAFLTKTRWYYRLELYYVLRLFLGEIIYEQWQAHIYI